MKRSLKELLQLNESKELYKGIFWIVDRDDLDRNVDYCFQIKSNEYGDVVVDPEFRLNAKTGTTYNHEKTWKVLPPKLTHNKSYNYYPRGRVEINNGKAIIYLNPNINTEEIKNFLIRTFHLYDYNGIKKVIMNSDGSDHYKCHLD